MGRPLELTAEQRESLLRQGFRPVEVWVPDDGNSAYLAEARRQAKDAARVDAQDNVMGWVDAVSQGGWDE